MQQFATEGRWATSCAAAICVAVFGLAGCSDDGGGGGTPADTGDIGPADSDSGAEDTGGSGSDAGDAIDAPGTTVTPESLQSFGVFPPQAVSCDSPSERLRIPFYYTSRKNSEIRPIKRGDLFRGELVQPGRTLGASSFATRRLRVAQAEEEACTSASDCEAPFKCGESGFRGAGRRCVRQSEIEFIPGTARQDFRPNRDPDSGQLVTVLVENTGMWNGLLPNEVAGKYGEDGNLDTSAKEGRASDPELLHREAISLFSRTLGTAVSEENTKVSMWFFGGETRSRARPLFMAGNRTEDFFTDQLQFPEQALESLPDPAPFPSNVYQSMLRVIDRDLGLSKYEDREKFLFLVTDGPNEVFDNSARRQDVLSALEENNVHLFVLHLDAELDPELLRDDPRYWAGPTSCREDETCQAQRPCSSDSDCASFETCRRGDLFAETMGEPVEQTEQKFCLPDYSDGRLGPIEDYADMACATGGNYLYTTKPEQMLFWARRLPNLFDGQWSVEAELSAFTEPVGLEDGFYRLSGAFIGLLSTNLVQLFSLPTGEDSPTRQLDDTRPVLRKGIVPGN